jgi:hypothetical protein
MYKLVWTCLHSWNDRHVPPQPAIGWDEVPQFFCPGWPHVIILSISACWVARITGMNHYPDRILTRNTTWLKSAFFKSLVIILWLILLLQNKIIQQGITKKKYRVSKFKLFILKSLTFIHSLLRWGSSVFGISEIKMNKTQSGFKNSIKWWNSKKLKFLTNCFILLAFF